MLQDPISSGSAGTGLLKAMFGDFVGRLGGANGSIATTHLPPPPIEGGSAVAVVPGVMWIRQPLEMPLGAINLWLIDDGDSWAVVDTGMRRLDAADSWQASFDEVLCGRPIKRVIATHMHPDHCGLAGWLIDRFGGELLMSQLEYLGARLHEGETADVMPDAARAFYRRAGWSAEEIARHMIYFGNSGRGIYPMPRSFQRLRPGDLMTIGGNEWRIVIGSGHSPEHVCLYCPALKLFISGDQVLPGISSNVSVHPVEPDANPLADWFTSLSAIGDQVEDDVLVLPAHNLPFEGLHHRLRQLIEGHQVGLERLLEHLSEPRRVVDLFPALFKRPVMPRTRFLATGETLAHLNFLRSVGLAQSEEDPAGVVWWRKG